MEQWVHMGRCTELLHNWILAVCFMFSRENTHTKKKKIEKKKKKRKNDICVCSKHCVGN